MLSLKIQREPSFEDATPGKMYVDGQFFCYTLEDLVRELRNQDGSLKDPKIWKIPGQTAIPSGTYRVILSYSNRFQRLLPYVVAVPGFVGVRLHGGNTAANTEGCPLLGLDRDDHSPSRIWNCAPVVLSLMQSITRAADGVQLEIVNDQSIADKFRARGLGVKL